MTFSKYPYRLASTRPFYVFLQKFVLTYCRRFYKSFSQTNSTLTILETPRPIVYPIVEQTLGSFHFFFFFSEKTVFFIQLDNEVIDSRSFSSFTKMRKIKLISKYKKRS